MSVGTSFTHDSAKLHVSGQARYVDDIPCSSNTLHLAFGLSTVAKGQIDQMDLSGVLSSEGVVRVIVAQDLPYENDSSPVAMDEPFLRMERCITLVNRYSLSSRKATILPEGQCRTP